MKILLITTLYPAFLNQSKIKVSYAVHFFAKQWTKNHEVQVIRLWPSYPGFLKLFSKVRESKKYDFEESFMLEEVNVRRIPINKIPKIDYRNNDINAVAEKIIGSIRNIPDVIICDILNPSIYVGEIVAREFNSKLIASLHNSDISYLSKEKNYKKYIKTDYNVNKIVFRSSKVEKYFKEIYKGPKNESDFKKILFGIEKKDIVDQDKLNRKISESKKIILTASSLKKLKNVDVLIKAFSMVKNRNGYVLKIIGDGPERKRLEGIVDELNCRELIFFEGEKSRKEVLNNMEESEIFVMVSSPETFGLVYIEAMAKGCITIGSKGEGIDGVIINNENGFLCTPGSIDNLKLTLEYVISLNDNEKRRIINNARMTAEALNYEELSNKFLEIVM